MAEALVGGAFLSASLQVLFDRLATREFINFFSKQKIDDGLLDKLKVTLMALQVVLDDAEDKQIANSTVKDWLDELQHVVYQADDLLDEIATKALRDKLEADDQPQTQSSTSKVGLSRFFHLMKQFLIRINCFVSTHAYLNDKATESKMKEVISRLEVFVELKKTLDLKTNVERKQWQREETSLVNESEVYGRNDDKEKIMKLLLSDIATRNQIPTVIPIVGMGGMGKTTLAQLVYNDDEVKEKFHMKAWVCVSDAFDSYKITKKILDDVTKSNNNIDNLDHLQIKLKEGLAGKKFLIVLDDVWNSNSNDWDRLRKPFIAGAQESRIIVTTRDEEVASVMGTIPIYHLEILSFKDCWSLFAKHAFGSKYYMAHSDLESIGKLIVEKCKGLPLAVKSIGGLLWSKRDIEYWKYILNSEIWNLKSDVNPALRLSYHYLPSNLKRCFAHCSKFPKDYKFEKEKLVRLWIAEDLVQQPKNNKLMEDEGNYYFHELLSRSFFQRLSDNNSYFVMHDLLHDLAQHISRKFCFRLDDDKPLDYICEKVRHFSYVQGCKFEKFMVVNEVKCLQTFISFPIEGWVSSLSDKVLHDMLSNLRCLRVLSLSQYLIYELPRSIENLILLRYLDLSNTQIKRLPDSVTTLYNLQTLDLSYCKILIELPVNMRKLINLHYLDIRKTKLTEMPKQMSKLKDLQHLTNFVIGKDGGSRISELKELCQLRGQLHISRLQNVGSVADALEANLKGKGHLEGLELEWGSIAINTDDLEKERDILDRLEPHAGVKHLGIINYGHTRFPVWLERVHLFRDMTSLHLISCVNCYSLPSIGQLPFLKYLRIERMKAITNVSLPPMLKTLEIKECDALQSVEEAAAVAVAVASSEEQINNCHCRLEELRISDCSSLVQMSLPIATLKILDISGCRRLEFPLLSPSAEKEHNYHTSIEEVSIKESCDLLKSLWLGFFPKLRSLDISGCINLETLLIPNEELQNLMTLEIEHCPKMVSFGHGDGMISFGRLSAPNLTSFKVVDCSNLKSLLQQMHTLLPSLQELKIDRCPEVESFPDGGLPSNLRELDIYDCKKLMKGRKRWGLQQTLFSLEYFIIGGKYEEQVLESFPEEWLLPTTLARLWLLELPNLKSLNHKGLQHLTSLTDLYIHDCPKLQSLPEQGLPNSLSYLYIFKCPLLKPRCQREKGEDWPKISPIRHICIDHEDIVNLE